MLFINCIVFISCINCRVPGYGFFPFTRLFYKKRVQQLCDQIKLDLLFNNVSRNVDVKRRNRISNNETRISLKREMKSSYNARQRQHPSEHNKNDTCIITNLDKNLIFHTLLFHITFYTIRMNLHDIFLHGTIVAYSRNTVLPFYRNKITYITIGTLKVLIFCAVETYFRPNFI